MSASDFIARAKQRLSPKRVATERTEVESALEKIREERGFVQLGGYASEFMKHQFYAVFEDRLKARADALHEDLLNGTVSPEAYSRAYRLIKETLLLAPSAVERGLKAGEQLEAWREDGTLEEAELWRGRERSSA